MQFSQNIELDLFFFILDLFYLILVFQRRTPEVYLSLGVYRIESAPFRCGRCYFKFCLPDNRPGYILPVAVLGEICELLSDNTIVCFAFLFLLSSIFTIQFFLVLQSIQCVIETEDRVFVFSVHVIRFYVCFLGAEGNKNFFCSILISRCQR